MRIAAQALIRFAERHAEKARALAAEEPDPRRKAELERNCGRVHARPGPRPARLLGGAASLLVRPTSA